MCVEWGYHRSDRSAETIRAQIPLVPWWKKANVSTSRKVSADEVSTKQSERVGFCVHTNSAPVSHKQIWENEKDGLLGFKPLTFVGNSTRTEKYDDT